MNPAAAALSLCDFIMAMGIAFISAILLDVAREKLANWWRARK